MVGWGEMGDIGCKREGESMESFRERDEVSQSKAKRALLMAPVQMQASKAFGEATWKDVSETEG